MKPELNPTISRYFESGNQRNETAFLACFAADAAVVDEKETHVGHAAILAWFHRTREEYDFQSVPISTSSNGEEIVVTATVSGNFPGSPVDLSYRFVVSGGVIQKLFID